jgi:hypothetical protein
VRTLVTWILDFLTKKLNSMASVCERTILTERPPLVDEVSATFVVESLAWLVQRVPMAVFCFPDRGRYFFFQAVTQFYSRGLMDPVPDPLLLRKCGSAGNRTRTSGSVARNSEH